MQRDTHQALITDEEAEAILTRLEAGRIKTYKTRAKHLLTGMLVSPEGEAMHGDGQYYRLGKKSVKASRIDGAVLQKIVEDLTSDEFCAALVKSARKAASKTDDRAELETAQKEIRVIDAKVEKLSNMLTESSRGLRFTPPL